jgi:protein-L-isoaspartate(D-aspartate) O-methyltransferase
MLGTWGMIDYAQARRTMVECQIRTHDVTDARILDAMTEIAREVYVPAGKQALAYVDRHVDIGGTPTRFMLEPAVFARLLKAAAITPADRILDVGCGLGYSSAVLSLLGRSVVAIESDAGLVGQAASLLASHPTVSVVQGDLAKGQPRQGPYDVIILQGAIETAPETLLGQLAEGGRLVAIIGEGRAAQATVFLNVKGDVSSRVAFDAAAPRLPGFAKIPAFTF